MTVIAAFAILFIFSTARGNPNPGHDLLTEKEAGDISDDMTSAEGPFVADDLNSPYSTGKRGEFNSWGGKRGEFNSWGGKRGEFNSWGGKRGEAFNSWGGKRGEFNSWGGKRATSPFNSWGGKREFNSWGGKRAAATFNSWGGKRQGSNGRSSNDQASRRASPLVSRTPFNSWGGKRGTPFEMTSNNLFDKSLPRQDSEKTQLQGNGMETSHANLLYV